MSRRAALAVAAAMLFALFAIDAGLVLSGKTLGVDHAALTAFRDPADASQLRFPGEMLDALIGVTAFGAWYVRLPIAAVGTLLLARDGRRREATILAASVALAALLLPLIKDLFDRTRPDMALRLVAARHSSFPSGHALGATATYPLLGHLSGRRLLLWSGIVLAVAIGISRVALGVHWLSDVAGGWLLGAAWVAGTTAVLAK